MATLRYQKARKNYKCSKCGKVIEKGEGYYRFSTSRFSPLVLRCLACKPLQSEMTKSEFLSIVYSVEETLSFVNDEMSIDELKECVESAISELTDLRDETEDKLYNMPEQLQNGDIGQLLQDRVDNVQTMLDELDDILNELDDEDIDKSEIVNRISDVAYEGE